MRTYVCRKEKGGLTSTVCAPTADVSLHYRIALEEITLLGGRIKTLADLLFGKPGRPAYLNKWRGA